MVFLGLRFYHREAFILGSELHQKGEKSLLLQCFAIQGIEPIGGPSNAKSGLI